MIDFNNRLEQLEKKIKSYTKKSHQSVKKFVSKYKRTMGTSLLAATLLTTVIHTDSVKAEGTPKHNLETLYHVYVDGARIGTIDDENSIERIIDEAIREYQETYEDLNFILGSDVTVVPEFVFKLKANTTSTLRELEKRLDIKAEAVALIVDGKEVAYVRSEEDYEEVSKKLKLQYVSEDELAKVMDAKEEDTSLDGPSVDETMVLDVRLSKEIETMEMAVDPKKVLSVKEAVKQLNLGTLEDDVYLVEPGDVLSTIAVAHELSKEELIALNANITENTLLQIGAELNVTVYEPIVKVIVEEAKKVQEEIKFQIETKDDANMWRGDTKVQQEGQNGERVISYSITRENGRIIEEDIVSEKIIKEPVDHLVLRGIKVSTSRGTGKLSWPAVGGYISSYQGTRWGSYHKGIDIARPTNRNILAADNGTIIFAGWDGGYGNKIIINHNNGMRTLYAHLASIDVNVGQTVAKGRKIGVMGTTGNSTGIHLHFEVYQNNQLKDPMNYLNR
ncbi:M23 family metallopeptidase [Bacillaceae bacterium IKA-2]|nr:M23 family metallopeptidase [Bacillaceae bacterium IKA-2]